MSFTGDVCEARVKRKDMWEIGGGEKRRRRELLGVQVGGAGGGQ